MLIAIISFTSFGVRISSAPFESLCFFVSSFSLKSVAGVTSFVGVLDEIPTSLMSSGRTIEIADLSTPKYLFATRLTSAGVTFFMFSR